MKISSLKRGDHVEFDCYGCHYFAQVINQETKRGGLIASYRSSDESIWFNKGYFNKPENIRKTPVGPPAGFKLPL